MMRAGAAVLAGSLVGLLWIPPVAALLLRVHLSATVSQVVAYLTMGAAASLVTLIIAKRPWYLGVVPALVVTVVYHVWVRYELAQSGLSPQPPGDTSLLLLCAGAGAALVGTVGWHRARRQATAHDELRG